MRHRRFPGGSRGAALLAALVTVALVAVIAAAAAQQLWRNFEVFQAERERVQANWILAGAVDWAREVLRQDGRVGGADHLGEAWAVPLAEVGLAAFLGAGERSSHSGLAGEITDLQARLNASNLVEAGGVSADGMRSFRRLFELLGLPEAELERLAAHLREATVRDRRTASAPLLPQTFEQLAWAGISASTLAALQPYVTVLPTRTAVNLNTAAPEVIYAAIDGITLAEAQMLVAARQRSHFLAVSDAVEMVASADGFASAFVSVNSRFFEVRARLRAGVGVIEERSLVQRTHLDVVTLSSERGGAATATLASAAHARR